jgi:tetratricopeptide (TPR) repeat protein
MTRVISWGVFVLFFLGACASTYSAFRGNMFQGKTLLADKEYKEARENFLKAASIEKSATAYAFAATASYKMNDLAAAEGYIKEAEKIKGGGIYLRTAGYKTLILLKEGRKPEGLDALKRYVEIYNRNLPLPSVKENQAMLKRGEVDLGRLEQLMDEQINGFDRDMEQLETGLGIWSGSGGAGGRTESP